MGFGRSDDPPYAKDAGSIILYDEYLETVDAQGRAARWIPRIEGCYFNVVGLRLALVSTQLKSRNL